MFEHALELCRVEEGRWKQVLQTIEYEIKVRLYDKKEDLLNVADLIVQAGIATRTEIIQYADKKRIFQLNRTSTWAEQGSDGEA